MNRSTVIPDTAYRRALSIAAVLGTTPGAAFFELNRLADGRIETSDNLGVPITEDDLKKTTLNPLEIFISRTDYLDPQE